MTLLHSNNKASRSLREVLQIKSILDPMAIIHCEQSHRIPEKSALGWLLRACPENRIVERQFFCRLNCQQYLSLHSDSQVPISGDLWGRSKVSRAGLSAALSKWVIRDDTNAWCWLPATRFPAHRSWPHDTWPLHYSGCIRGKWWGKRRDLSVCGRDWRRREDRMHGYLLNNEWLALRVRAGL